MIRTLALAALSVVALSGTALAAGDAEAGADIFKKKCAACHAIGDQKPKATGPTQNELFGRVAGTLETYAKKSGKTRFSKAMIAAGAEGLVWTPETVAEYLVKPKDYIEKNKMAFAGLKKEQDIADVIAYLATFSPDYVPAE